MRHKTPTNLILLCICNICLHIVCVCVFQGNVAFSSQGDRIASTQIEQMRSEHNFVLGCFGFSISAVKSVVVE